MVRLLKSTGSQGCEARDHVLQTSLTNKPHFELPQALRASHFPISSTAQLTTEEQDKLPPSRVCHSVLRSALQTPQSRRQTSKDVIHHMVSPPARPLPTCPHDAIQFILNSAIPTTHPWCLWKNNPPDIPFPPSEEAQACTIELSDSSIQKTVQYKYSLADPRQVS